MAERDGLFPNGNPRPGAVARYAAGYEADGVGRDPRRMTKDELRALGHGAPLLRAIRTNCIECQGSNEAEVRRCALIWCPFWPYRMASNPFHTVALSDEQRAERAARLAAARNRPPAEP